MAPQVACEGEPEFGGGFPPSAKNLAVEPH